MGKIFRSLFFVLSIFVLMGCRPAAGEVVSLTPRPTRQVESEPSATDIPVLPTPTIEPSPTPTATPQDIDHVQHPEWQPHDVDVTAVASQLGCDPAQADALVVEDACPDSEIAQGCYVLYTAALQWGDDETTLVQCRYVEVKESETDAYLYNIGIDHFLPIHLIVIRPDGMTRVKNLIELQVLLAPIETSEQALTYAQAYTGLTTVQFEGKPHLLLDYPVTYYADTLEDSYVETTDAGFNVLLYDLSDDCTPWTTTAVRLQITPDGQVTTLETFDVYNFDDNTCY